MFTLLKLFTLFLNITTVYYILAILSSNVLALKVFQYSNLYGEEREGLHYSPSTLSAVSLLSITVCRLQVEIFYQYTNLRTFVNCTNVLTVLKY